MENCALAKPQKQKRQQRAPVKVQKSPDAPDSSWQPYFIAIIGFASPIIVALINKLL
jgi:hypothetical protein